MLRFLRLQNWKSCYEPVEFTMTATRERRHGDRLAKVAGSRILPVTALYGANAAGKSTFVDGLAVLQRLVRDVRAKGDFLPVIPHRLKGIDQPTFFSIEFVTPDADDPPVGDLVFYYEIEADRQHIRKEALYRIRSNHEECLFEREGKTVELFGRLETDRQATAFAQIIADNQTFLGALGNADARPETVGRAYDWFANQLSIIHPGSHYVALPARIAADDLFAQAMNQGLTTADTGISEVALEDIPLESVPMPPAELKAELEKPGAAGRALLLGGDAGDFVLLHLAESGEPIARRVVTCHRADARSDGGPSFTLPLREESDGTARFMNLLPILFQLRESDQRGVFIVDELENSMHPLLTEVLIRRFLDGLGPSERRQLVFTTHELQLMRSDMLRRDEIWLAQKEGDETRLTRVSDFSREGVRKDADLLGFYTSGRLGGVPRL